MKKTLLLGLTAFVAMSGLAQATEWNAPEITLTPGSSTVVSGIKVTCTGPSIDPGNPYGSYLLLPDGALVHLAMTVGIGRCKIRQSTRNNLFLFTVDGVMQSGYELSADKPLAALKARLRAGGC